MIAGGQGQSQTYDENENLTLSEADLQAIGTTKPTAGGKKLRAYCPIHGSDHQRSLEVDMDTGRFFCHSCAAWGYLDWAREEFARERGLERSRSSGGRRTVGLRRPPPPPKPVEPVRDDLEALAGRFQEAMPGSWGEKYLCHRGLPLELARQYGVGYAAPKEWPGRGWKGGRLVAPHTRPDGTVVNLYGRAVARGEVPKQRKHDHLPGQKGYWNARVLQEGSVPGSAGPLYVVEGLFDALALIAFGCDRTVAIFSARDWRWHWLPKDVRQIVLAFDADETGVEAREKLATEARLKGIEVAYLDDENYGGENDPAAAYAAGVLDVGEWPDTWDPEWAANLFPEVLRDFTSRAREAGLDSTSVDDSDFDVAIREMQAAYEREDWRALREAAHRAREAAYRAVQNAVSTSKSTPGGTKSVEEAVDRACNRPREDDAASVPAQFSWSGLSGPRGKPVWQ